MVIPTELLPNWPCSQSFNILYVAKIIFRDTLFSTSASLSANYILKKVINSYLTGQMYFKYWQILSNSHMSWQYLLQLFDTEKVKMMRKSDDQQINTQSSTIPFILLSSSVQSSRSGCRQECSLCVNDLMTGQVQEGMSDCFLEQSQHQRLCVQDKVEKSKRCILSSLSPFCGLKHLCD